ncbi:MAG TPA: hypothetical protein VMU77_02270 [Acidimicrobiales bacterium]|nr:hypothetical protein [Acidimicrobiales bacterium]
MGISPGGVGRSLNGLLTATCEVGGTVVMVSTAASMISTLVIPRGYISPLFKIVDRTVDGAFRLFFGKIQYAARDRILAGEAPLIILSLLLGWLGFFVFGFTLMLLPVSHGFDNAIRQSASSTFTLGFALRSGADPTWVDFVAAATGMISIALQIGYMPTLYSAYNRREVEVTLLGLRAGSPPWGPELISRAVRLGTLESLPEFYQSWERWSADVTESHASYPVLLRFRSPHGQTSWVVALLAVLDSASMLLAVAPSRATLQTRLCLRAGFLCMRRLAETVGIQVDHDPSPEGEIQLPRERFIEAYTTLAEIGFEMERSPQDAWAHFKGWRINYESAAYALAKEVDAVPAYWSGPRNANDAEVAPSRVVNRTPENPSNGP